MAALKKAYADIILNTAKEAAARIMVSETKTLRFKQELSSSKKEAVNLLLRMKQIMDSKIAESERASLSQNLRIQELESQLNEAEDTVVLLRTDLEKAQDELKHLRKIQAKSLSFLAGNTQVSSQEDTHQIEVSPCNKDSPVSGSENDTPTTKSMDKHLDWRSKENEINFSYKNAASATINKTDLQSENGYACSPDITSFILQSNELEPYRNGCTQRIRALEQNLLSAKLPFHEQTCNTESVVKTEIIIKERETTERIYTASSPKIHNQSMEVERNSIICIAEDSKLHGNFCMKKRSIDRDMNKATGNINPLDQILSKNNPLNKDTEDGQDNRVHDSNCLGETPGTPYDDTKGNDPSDLDENKTMPLDVQNMVEGSKSDGFTLKKAVLDDCKKAEIVDISAIDQKEGKTSKVANDRILKYTFRRKRKREIATIPCIDSPLDKKNVSKRQCLSNPSPDSSGDRKGATKKRNIEKQCSFPESKKPSLISESSRDSRRLAQVARQLISLSEKRWW